MAVEPIAGIRALRRKFGDAGREREGAGRRGVVAVGGGGGAVGGGVELEDPVLLRFEVRVVRLLNVLIT